jgi:hypothetical protein
MILSNRPRPVLCLCLRCTVIWDYSFQECSHCSNHYSNRCHPKDTHSTNHARKLLNMSNQPTKNNMPCTPYIQTDFITPPITDQDAKIKPKWECADCPSNFQKNNEFLQLLVFDHALFYAACNRVIRRACICSFLRLRASHPSSSSDADTGSLGVTPRALLPYVLAR